MGRDDQGTLTRLSAVRRDVLEPLIAEHGGRVIKLVGDGLLVEFPSAVNALACAVAWQEAVAAGEAERPEDTRLKFRIGLHLGDILAEDGDIYGDGVNLAARLEAEAQPGGICVSDDIHRHAKGKLPVAFEDLGERQLKNIADPVQLYRVHASVAGSTHVAPPVPDKPSIAVLPFDNMSADPDQDYFSDGVTEDIITELSRFSTLFVIARNSSFSYKGKATDLKQVASELGVQYILEGSIRCTSARYRSVDRYVDPQPYLGRTLRPRSRGYFRSAGGDHPQRRRLDRPADRSRRVDQGTNCAVRELLGL